jgi:hypothetical protein
MIDNNKDGKDGFVSKLAAWSVAALNKPVITTKTKMLESAHAAQETIIHYVHSALGRSCYKRQAGHRTLLVAVLTALM